MWTATIIDIGVGDDDEPAVAASADPTTWDRPARGLLFGRHGRGRSAARFPVGFRVRRQRAQLRQHAPESYLHVRTNDGTFVAFVRVTDSDGDVDESAVTVTVDEDTTPLGAVAVTTTPAPAEGSDAAACSVSAVTPAAGNPPFTYLWDFGDGSTADLQNPTHTYQSGGAFTARCTVTDANGESGSASTAIRRRAGYRAVSGHLWEPAYRTPRSRFDDAYGRLREHSEPGQWRPRVHLGLR